MNYYYSAYYRRAINDYRTGLKLVLGGTGLGKTSSLGALLRSGEFPDDTKFIYIANRIQLLDEMAEQVRDLGIHIQQRQDVEHLREAVADGTLTALLSSMEGGLLIDEYNRQQETSPIRLEVLKKKVTQFKRLEQFSDDELADIVDVSAYSWELLSPLKQLLSLAKRLAEVSPGMGQLITQKRAANLAHLPLWSTLFPYVRFQTDPGLRLLLVTVQKSFRGLYDGRRTVRLGNWRPPATGHYVFVFDEFDFLENDLLMMLSEDKEVSDPFGMVRTFYERIKSQKLSHDDYLTQKPGWQEIRNELTEICDRIASLKDVHRIDFPAITHFVTKDKAIKGRAIFQSNYSLVNQTVYLKDPSERPFSFDLTTAKGGNSAFVLLDVVSRAVKDIIRLFKRLETDHDDIYPELLRQCFEGTDYQREIQRVKQIGWRHEWCETNYGYLLTNGFGLFEIRTDQSRLTDPDEVAIRYLSMSNSPEAMMREMCRVHLVFGLSATAHINRTLRNFDWSGLAHPLVADESFQPLPISAEDQADINQANHEKAAVRNSSIHFDIAEPLLLSTSFGLQLAAIADRSGDVFGLGEQKSHRLKRTRHFFGLLTWLCSQNPDVQAIDYSQMKTHLVFLSSLKQLRYLFQTVKQDEDNWFCVTPHALPMSLASLECYELSYRDESTGKRLTCHVVLYDARFGQALRKEPALEEQYNALFWDDKPVIVVTTYPSAGNGVNLQYYLTREDYQQQRTAGKRDFNNLHLLDSPYFYFSPVEPEGAVAETMAVIKRNVYGLMKLLHAKHISEAQAIGQLGQITRLNTFNSAYLNMPDGVLNQLSVFVQALGRIERVWQATSDQTIRLDKEVYQVFERFMSEDELHNQRQNYLRYASTTMQALLSAIAEYAQIHRDSMEDELLDINRANQQARKAIHELVMEIQMFQQTGKPADIRQRWNRLRDDVLKHNMQADSLKQIGGVFNTNYVREGQLFINKQGQIAPPTIHSHEFAPWNLNSVYHSLTIIPNTAITNYFRVRGYELAFLNTVQSCNTADIPTSGRFFLPYVYQSILTGAIGEETTQAILRMKKIQATGDTIPDALFEVADLRVSYSDGRPSPVFIDCKNYGMNTIRHFSLPPDDPLYNPALNEPHFKEKMVRKWALIDKVVNPTANEPCRLVIVNLVHDEEGALRYYNTHFESVDTWDDARIIVLTGALKPLPTDPKDLLTPACTNLINNLIHL